MTNNRTPLYEEHVRLGAKIIDFHGWDMPLQYTKILEEHMAVRNKVGIFDVSHMGDVVVSGKDAAKFLDHMFPTSISSLKEGEAVYTAFLNDDGKIIDDTIVYRLAEEKFFFVPNASMIDIMLEWVNTHKNDYDVDIINYSNDIACIAIQGPESRDVVSSLNLPFADSFKFNVVEGNYNNNRLTESNSIIVSGTGYTGETGVELLVPAKDAASLWRKVLGIVKEKSGLPCGLGSRDTLRMEKGMLLSGTDFSSDRNPFECSISFIVNNQGDYIGKKSIENKGDYIFRGFRLNGKMIPRAGSKVILDNQEIGIITSGTLSPVLDSAIALGFVKRKFIKSGPAVMISVRDKLMDAEMGRPKIVP